MKKNNVSSEQWIRRRYLTRLIICNGAHLNSAMQRLLDAPDFYLQNSEGPFFKWQQGDTTTVGVVRVADKTYVVKRYNYKSFWHRLKVWFRGTRLQRAWRYGLRLKTLGIPTVQPVAMIEERYGPFHGRGYLITEYVPGIKGSDYFGAEFKPQSNWRNVADTIAHLARQMHAARLSHADFHCGNMLIVEQHAVLLDLDHVQYHHTNFFLKRHHHKDIALLLKYLKRDNVIVYEYLADILQKP